MPVLNMGGGGPRPIDLDDDSDGPLSFGARECLENEAERSDGPASDIADSRKPRSNSFRHEIRVNPTMTELGINILHTNTYNMTASNLFTYVRDRKF